MIAFASAVSFCAWVYLVAFHGKFWRSSQGMAGRPAQPVSRVCVVVPARNEAESMGASIGSLLKQQYGGELRVVLVDDGSTDGTAEIAASLDGGDRLRIIRGESLPAGWSGKLWAVHQGLQQDEAKSADFVLLTDADIVHGAGHVAALVAKAEAEGLDLTSEMVRLHCTTLAERALIPAFVFFFQMLYPFDWVNDAAKRVAGAAGGTMLVSRAALDRVEGVSRIRQNLIDDCALAKEIKKTGGRIWLGHAEAAESVRVYAKGRDVWDMIARTAYVQLGHSLVLLAGCVAGMGILYCAPPALALFAHGWARVLGAACWLMMALAFQPTLRRYRCSPLWGAALPAIALFYVCATVASAVAYYAGRGGNWKSRVYPQERS